MEARELLAPLDGSPVADAVLPYAERLAHLTGGTVHLLSVVETPAYRFPGPTARVRTSVERLKRTRLEQHLRETAADLAARDRRMGIEGRVQRVLGRRPALARVRSWMRRW